MKATFWKPKKKPSAFIIPSGKNMKRKDLSWQQAKALHPKLNPFKDADKDGVINMLDCRPFDKKRQDLPNIGPSIGNSPKLVGGYNDALNRQLLQQAQQGVAQTMQQVQHPERIVSGQPPQAR